MTANTRFAPTVGDDFWIPVILGDASFYFPIRFDISPSYMIALVKTQQTTELKKPLQAICSKYNI